ncbi:MAG: lipopolysaccharide kinase InaA family protein [Halioglobus sp.]|nr:lipopolysaccharide kinase InaA family protein [Halioglobus sp.]
MSIVLNRWNVHLSISENYCPVELDDAEEFVDELFANGELIKEDHRSHIVRGQYKNEGFVAKCYKPSKRRYVIHGLLRGRGSLPAWNNIFTLRKLGIPTLEPVLLLEQRFLRLPRNSYLVTREIQGVELRTFLKENGGELNYQQLAGLRYLLEKFYGAQLIHGDMNEANIMVTEQGSLIIDLDKLHKPVNRQTFFEQFDVERNRFLRKLEPWPIAKAQIAALFPM